MLSEPVTVETSETEFSRRLGSAVQLRALEKSETKKVPKLYQGGSLQLGMIDLNLFRLFDAMLICACFLPIASIVFDTLRKVGLIW